MPHFFHRFVSLSLLLSLTSYRTAHILNFLNRQTYTIYGVKVSVCVCVFPTCSTVSKKSVITGFHENGFQIQTKKGGRIKKTLELSKAASFASSGQIYRSVIISSMMMITMMTTRVAFIHLRCHLTTWRASAKHCYGKVGGREWGATAWKIKQWLMLFNKSAVKYSFPLIQLASSIAAISSACTTAVSCVECTHFFCLFCVLQFSTQLHSIFVCSSVIVAVVIAISAWFMCLVLNAVAPKRNENAMKIENQNIKVRRKRIINGQKQWPMQ